MPETLQNLPLADWAISYDYIIGAEFASTVGSIADVQEKVAALQSKEERDHQTLWKTRRALHERLERLYADMSSGIESIRR